MDFINQFPTRQLINYCMVMLLFINKQMTALVTGHHVPAEVPLLWLLDEVSEAESVFSSFLKNEEVQVN